MILIISQNISASTKEFKTIDETANWVSIYKLLELRNDYYFFDSLTDEKREFAENIIDYLHERGKPPPLKNCTRRPDADRLYIPQSISTKLPPGDLRDFDTSLEHSRIASANEKLTRTGLLRKQIVELLREGENDVFGITFSLHGYKVGQVLKVLTWMAKRGEVIMSGEDVELNAPVRPVPTRQIPVSAF